MRAKRGSLRRPRKAGDELEFDHIGDENLRLRKGFASSSLKYTHHHLTWGRQMVRHRRPRYEGKKEDPDGKFDWMSSGSGVLWTLDASKPRFEVIRSGRRQTVEEEDRRSEAED